MSTSEDEKEFFEKRGFGKTIGFGKRPAVIVIDLIRAFTDYTNPKMLLAANLESQMVEVNRILEVSHEKEIPALFTTVVYEDKQFRDSGVWGLKQAGSITLESGTSAIEIDPSLHFNEGDMLISKKYASAFFGTDLISRLVSQQVDTLIITGCTTSGCVRSTAVDAVSYGFRPMVVREAVGDRSEAAHEQSLFDLQAKYADVVTTEEVLSYLKGLPNKSERSGA